MLVWAPLFSLCGTCETCFLASGCSSHGRDRPSDFLSGGSLLALLSMCTTHALHCLGTRCPNRHPDQNSIVTRKSVQLTGFCSHLLSLWIPFSSFFSATWAHHFPSTSSVPSALLWSSAFQRKVPELALEFFMVLFRNLDYKTTRTPVNTNILINSWTPGPVDWMRTWIILGLFWKNFRRIAKLIQSSRIPFTVLSLMLTSVES